MRAQEEQVLAKIIGECTAAQALTQSLDLDTVLHPLLKHLRRLVPADTASVFFREGETVWGIRAAEGYERWTTSQDVLSVKIEAETSPIFEKIVSTCKGLAIPDIATERDWITHPDTAPIPNRLYAPIVVEENLIGIVGLGKLAAGFFTEEHMHWAEALVG